MRTSMWGRIAGLVTVIALLGVSAPAAAAPGSAAAPAPGTGDAAARAAGAPAASLAAGEVCDWNPVAIVGRNGRYVTVETGYTGSNYAMLRATATSVGTAQTFYYCWRTEWDTNHWALLSAATGLYVSAEFDYSGTNKGMMRARAGALGSWERFARHFNSGYENWQFTSTGQYALSELDYTGSRQAMLRVRSWTPDIWERFTPVWL